MIQRLLRLWLWLWLEVALEKVTRGGGWILSVEGPRDIATAGDITTLPGIIHILRRFFRWNPANPIEGHTLGTRGISAVIVQKLRLYFDLDTSCGKHYVRREFGGN